MRLDTRSVEAAGSVGALTHISKISKAFGLRSRLGERFRIKVYLGNRLRSFRFRLLTTSHDKVQGSEFNVIDRMSRSRGPLSPREREVVFLAIKGFANKAIARQLDVTEGTVKLHLHRVYQKLGIKSRFALAVLAKDVFKKLDDHGGPDAA